jgi:GNAT superfamily N-acetyltransferase
MLTIDRVEADEQSEVLALLNGARQWLHDNDVDQWPCEFTPERLGTDFVDMFIVRENGSPVACIRISPEPDRVFWNDTDAEQPAMYLSRMAVTEHGRGLGELMWRWAVDYAHQLGYLYMRLDCRRDNIGLQRYYASRGWKYVRTVEAEGRFSGALFQRDAVPDVGAWIALQPSRQPGGWLDPGTPVVVDGHGQGEVVSVQGHDDELNGLGEPDGEMPGRYLVRLDDGTQVAAERSEVHAG